MPISVNILFLVRKSTLSWHIQCYKTCNQSYASDWRVNLQGLVDQKKKFLKQFGNEFHQQPAHWYDQPFHSNSRIWIFHHLQSTLVPRTSTLVLLQPANRKGRGCEGCSKKKHGPGSRELQDGGEKLQRV